MPQIVQTTFTPLDPYAGKAADRTGALLRSQYEEHQRTFVPLENQLMQMTTYNNPDLLPEELTKAQTATEQQFNSFAKAPTIQIGRYGMNMTGDQQQVSDRLTNIGHAAALTDAANTTRISLMDRNRQIATGMQYKPVNSTGV